MTRHIELSTGAFSCPQDESDAEAIGGNVGDIAPC